MQNGQSLSDEQLQSNVISFLRFPLCVGVVLIHIWIGTNDCPVHPIYDFTRYLFAQIFARIAVPMFFMFSGFLFFYKKENFSVKTYTNNLRKRATTLFVPYVFWNFATILYYLIGRYVGYAPQFGIDFTFADWLRTFWDNTYPEFNGEGIASYPICVPMWYIRDLMVTSVMSPLIYWLLKRTNISFVLLLGFLWITNYWPLITGINITAIFFFSLGAYIAIYNKNFVKIVKPHTSLLGISYLAFIIPTLISQELCWNPLRRMGILIGMAFVISFVARFIERKKWNVDSFLSDSSFFIYSCHRILIMAIGEVINISFRSDIVCTISYFLMAVLITSMGFALYSFLRRRAPRFTALITGGR